MRICELLLAPAYGGAETMALRLARRWRELGHEVDLCALDEQSGEIMSEGGEIEVLATPGWARGKRLRRFAALRHRLRAGSYDVVLAQTYVPNAYARLAAATSRGAAPVVITLQSAGDDYTELTPRVAERALGHWTAAVAAVSPRLGEQYARRFPALADRVTVVPNAVEIVANERVAATSAPRVFAVVGRLTRFKGVETAIRGFAAFKQASSDGQEILRIVGPDTDEAYAAELRALAAASGCEAIVFDGAVPEPFDALPIDVLVHPSHREGHPVTLLEAAARAIPVICTDVPEITSAVGGHCGTFTLGDESSLAHALASVGADWGAARTRARLARDQVPTIEDAADRYLEIFESVVTRSRSTVDRAGRQAL